MMVISQWPLPAIIALFLAATLVITIGGTLITELADRLADYTGVGEAFMGALFLGGATSLPGIVTSVAAAAEGHPNLAVSNALGGIAAQTAFLGIADLAYRKANLEHAAASMPELVIAVAAVKRGALTLAVGDVLGGNCFDVLFIAFADMAYREGSIYHAMVSQHILMIALPILLTSILLLGLLHREKHGVANIGFESFLVVAIYLGVFSMLIWSG